MSEPPRRRWSTRAVVALCVGGLLGVVGLGVAGAAVLDRVLAWWAWDDAVYGVTAWSEANPHRDDRTEPPPLLEHHDCPFAGEWGAEDVRCATLVVPADRSDATSTATVELAVAVLPATGTPVADPILYLEGGPGGASVAWFDDWVDSTIARLRRDRDVILLDQRGAGYSAPTLGCEEAWSVEGDDLAAAIDGCLQAASAEGAVLPGVSTREHAADVADLRRLLEVDAWNLVGVSYGTRVALAVLRDHPEGVRSAVLDSAYPPDVEVLTSQGDIAFAAFDGLAEACVADVGCATDHGDPREQLVAAASTLDAEPVTLDGRTFDGPALVREVTASLYDEYLLTELPAILATAAEDPAAGLEELGWWDDEPMLGWGPRRRSPVPAYAESDGTFFAVECREAVATADLTEARARAAALPAPFDRAAARDLDELTAVCDRVASGVASAQELAPAVSDVPTLLLAGGLDPVTPPAWATHAATTLDRATVVTFPALGHGVLYSGTCATGLATRFLDDPTAAPDDACTRAFGHVRFGR